tara:strand:+ start:557 stop:724 length:168 start_codon:yes stop_codon:yes gene_type:complete
MKNSKFTFLQQRIQRRRREASDITPEHIEEKMSPQRKEFLDLLEKTKQEYGGDKK